METQGRAAVIVVNYGSHQLLRQNLMSSVAGLDVAVVVVDNFHSSTEQAALVALAEQESWTAVLSPSNVGFGAGNRLGIDRALLDGARTFLLLNPDARLVPADLMRLLERASTHRSELVAPLVLRPDGTSFAELQDMYLSDGRMRASRVRPPDVAQADVIQWVSGACVAFSAELWDASGGFDDSYFLYWEDVDLSARVWECGGTVRVEEGVTAVHDEGGTHDFRSITRAKSPVYYYYNVRNRLLFAAKHLDRAGRRRWRRATARLALLVLLQGGRRQFLRPDLTLLPAVLGIRDGWRGRGGAGGPRTGGTRGSVPH
jgi:N-acetylglucosaminyl-diphospho-decaprenol L-rhamnosyltransferase